MFDNGTACLNTFLFQEGQAASSLSPDLRERLAHERGVTQFSEGGTDTNTQEVERFMPFHVVSIV